MPKKKVVCLDIVWTRRFQKNISFIINEWGMQLVQFVIGSKEHFMPNRNHLEYVVVIQNLNCICHSKVS